MDSTTIETKTELEVKLDVILIGWESPLAHKGYAHVEPDSQNSTVGFWKDNDGLPDYSEGLIVIENTIGGAPIHSAYSVGNAHARILGEIKPNLNPEDLVNADPEPVNINGRKHYGTPLHAGTFNKHLRERDNF